MIVCDSRNRPEFSCLPSSSPVILLNDCWVHQSQRTVIQVGVARSGTSALAGVLQGLGIEMDDSKDGHFERLVFREVFGRDVMKEEIQRLNDVYPVWGLKTTPNLDLINCLVSWTRNPCLVCIFRDVVAIASRRMLSFDRETNNALETLSYLFKEMDDFRGLLCCVPWFTRRRIPVIIVSYEKLKTDTYATVKCLAELFQSRADIGEVCARVNPNSGYLLQYPEKKEEIDENSSST